MQDSLLSILITNAPVKFRIYVLTYDSAVQELPGQAVHLPLGNRHWAKRLRYRLMSLRLALKYHWQSLPGNQRYKRWPEVIGRACREPSHYSLIRYHNIRLIYNLNQHSIPSPVPFIQTVWDANHRIHSFFPEFSYTRFGFEALDLSLRQSLVRCSYVVTGTEAGAKQLVQMLGVSASKIRVIPFPTPSLPPPSHSIIHTFGDYPFILYPARLWPHKNHSVIFHALAQLKQHYQIDFKLVSVGADSGNLEYLKSLALDLSISDRVHFAGEVDDNVLAMLYHKAFALVFASAVGPDNLPPLEAMAIGCPAIVARNEGTEEQFGDSVLTFSPYDEADLAKAIHCLATNPSLRVSLINKGKQLAAQQTPLSYVRMVFEIFEEFYLVARNWERCDSVFT